MFSQDALARALGVPPRRIKEIVLEKRGIIRRLARYFGTTGEMWTFGWESLLLLPFRTRHLPFSAVAFHGNLLDLVLAARCVNAEHNFVIRQRLALQDSNATELVRPALRISADLGFGFVAPFLLHP